VQTNIQNKCKTVRLLGSAKIKFEKTEENIPQKGQKKWNKTQVPNSYFQNNAGKLQNEVNYHGVKAKFHLFQPGVNLFSSQDEVHFLSFLDFVAISKTYLLEVVWRSRSEYQATL